jgi:hypothetical protein
VRKEDGSPVGLHDPELDAYLNEIVMANRDVVDHILHDIDENKVNTLTGVIEFREMLKVHGMDRTIAMYYNEMASGNVKMDLMALTLLTLLAEKE